MNKRFALGVCLGLAGTSILAFGCQSQARPTATPAPLPTQGAVVVVVTATLQPTLGVEDTVEPTITPLATLTPISSLGTDTPTTTATARKTATTAASTPLPTRAATVAVAATNPPPPAPPAQNKYPAPIGLTPSRANKDTVTEPAGIEFKFQSVGALQANECYLVHVDMINPNNPIPRGDDFLDPNSSHCGDQSAPGTILKFGMFGPKHGVPNYGTIESEARALTPDNPPKTLTGQWYVVVVQNNGPSGDGVHYQIVRESPISAPLEFDFVPTS